jgi:hypothetical protein
MLAVFGAAFAFLGVLLVAIVVGSAMRTSASHPDQDARDAWMLILGVGAVLAGAGVFGVLFRLALRSDSADEHDDAP